MRLPKDLEPIGFNSIVGFDLDDLGQAFEVFRRSAERIMAGEVEQRPACAAPPSLLAIAREAAAEGSGGEFFRSRFRPYRLSTAGFVTAYYEVEIEARLSPERGFETPVLSRPPDLVTLNDAPMRLPSGEALTSARRRTDGSLEPYAERRAIEDDGAAIGARPIAYIRDAVELFLLQVQGSARLRLPNGNTLALTYDGRNGWPYASVGRMMIERGIIPAENMSLDLLKSTLRRMGASGRELMQLNRSFVFFRIDHSEKRRPGPIGGEGCALTPFRSIAVDRSIWCYGLPFWIKTAVPWERDEETGFERLMIAQDTGSAILGPARADLFFGAGDQAGLRAGRVRHPAEMIVLLPAALRP